MLEDEKNERDKEGAKAKKRPTGPDPVADSGLAGWGVTRFLARDAALTGLPPTLLYYIWAFSFLLPFSINYR